MACLVKTERGQILVFHWVTLGQQATHSRSRARKRPCGLVLWVLRLHPQFGHLSCPCCTFPPGTGLSAHSRLVGMITPLRVDRRTLAGRVDDLDQQSLASGFGVRCSPTPWSPRRTGPCSDGRISSCWTAARTARFSDPIAPGSSCHAQAPRPAGRTTHPSEFRLGLATPIVLEIMVNGAYPTLGAERRHRAF